MKKVIKKSLSILIIMLFIISLFAGCKKETEKGAELIDNTYTKGLPMVKDKVELSVMIYKNAIHSDFNEMSFSKFLEEKANIKINWQYTSWGNDAVEKKTLAFATGNMPDIFILPPGSFFDYDAVKYSEQGMIMDLKPYFEQFAPNITAMMKKYPEIEAASAIDGKIFTLPRVEYNDRHILYDLKHYIRKTWLDNLGLEIPKTLEDYYDVLKQFKTGDPNGNGLADEIPFVYTNLAPSFLAYWGLNYGSTTYNMSMNQQTGKIEYAYGSDAMRDGLKYLNRLMSEGLISRDDFEDPSISTQTIKSGNVGSFMSFGAFVEAGYDLAEEYVILEPLDVGNGRRTTYYGSFDNIYPHMFMVTNKCKNIEAAVRFVDYFYSVEGYALANLGAPGEAYEFTEDGKIKNLKDVNESERHRLAPCGSMIWGVDNSLNERKFEKPENELGEIGLAEKNLFDECETKLKPYIPDKIIKKPILSLENGKLLTEKGTPLNQFALYNCLLFVLGEKKIDTEWNEHINELKRQGMDEIVAAYQEDYDKSYGDK